MYLKVFSLALVFVCAAGSLFAQDNFESEYQEKEFKEVQNINNIKKHSLGESIARKLQLLREAYTYKEVSGINNAETVITEKSAIFTTTKKVIRYFEKNAKKGIMDKDIATMKAEEVIDVALNIRYQQTEELEAVLWKTKDAEELFNLYANRVNMDGYESKLNSPGGMVSSND